MTSPQSTKPISTRDYFDQVTFLDEAPAGTGRPDWLIVFTGSSWAAAEKSGLKRARLWEFWRLAQEWCNELSEVELGWVRLDGPFGEAMYCGYMQGLS
jgi:hypothetical protein